MLQGLAGHLISETYLETLLIDPSPGDEVQSAHQRLARWRTQSADLGPATSLRAMFDAGGRPFAAVLGFGPPTGIAHDRHGVAATLRGESMSAALLVTAWGESFDPHWRRAVTEANRREAPYSLLFNGTRVRLIDASRSFTRRYIEFDLDQLLDDPRSFHAFWVVIKSRSLGDLVAASDRHAAGVCRSLRAGVLAASADVLSALAGPGPRRPPDLPDLNDAFEQALTIVYRMVFLLFAEARALVPLWHPTYRESYSLEGLREAAERPNGAVGLWDALRAIARLAHAGCRAGDLRVTAFNGRLFAPARTPLAERRNLDDEAARRAMLALSTRPTSGGHGRERIAYRDLGVEQLGAVYETLLDYQPHAIGSSARVELRPGSGLRKATGTFYTPQPIAEFVVRRTLGPLVRDAEPDRILQLRVVDPAMGSGAFLVAACRYLSTAYEAALVRSGACYPEDIGAAERAAIRRTVAERCLYGVDLNPMAVQLARLSLWLATLAGGRPLSFLDHRLHAGNSLLGAWLSVLRRAPARGVRPRSTGHREGLLFDDFEVRDALRDVMPVRFRLESTPNDTLEQVREKERALAALDARGSVLRTWRRVADLWCASWLGGDSVPASAYDTLVDFVLTGASALPLSSVRRYLEQAERVSQSHRFFHWELEYPEVFVAADGTRLTNPGFDAVIGNPPWDMIRADAGKASAEPRRLLRFSRDAGIYAAQSGGHANCYQLFVERAVTLTRAGGRVGLVLPGGLATDSGNAALRRYLMRRSDVDTIVGFDNHRGIFPIHRSIRFLLLTATTGLPTERIACRMGASDPGELDAVGDEPAAAIPWFNVGLPPTLLERISGDSLAIPWLRNTTDLAIAERAAALFPALGSDTGWRVRFGRELNATEDRQVFRAPREGLPVVEGKQIEPFVVDLRSSRWSIRERDARLRLPHGRYRRRRLAYRDVASATNRLTLIAALLPARCVSTHTLFCLRTALPNADQQLLCGLFNSFVLNYLVRLRVSTHVTTAVVEQLPVPTRDHAPEIARDIAALARVLSGRRDPAAAAKLQACVAGLYQLTVEEFAYVLSTFPLVPQVQREEALAEFSGEGNAAAKARRHEQ